MGRGRKSKSKKMMNKNSQRKKLARVKKKAEATKAARKGKR